MSINWRPRIDLISDGEVVAAAVADRPIRQLSDQTLHLKQQQDRQDPLSGRLVFTSAPLDESVQVNDFVYFDAPTFTFWPALAEVIQNDAGDYLASPRSFVVGMVIGKSTDTLGDILQVGRINLTTEGVDPNGLVEDPVLNPFTAGRYFLSDRVPGKMTQSLRTPCIQVGFFTTEECHVQPLQKDLADTHYHFRFPLVAQPAASQNFLQTGWSSHGVSGDAGRKFVDYYNAGSDVVPPAILLCIRPSGALPVEPDSPVRVEFYNDGGQLHVQVFGAGVSITAPGSGSIVDDQALVPWPDYGAWIAVPGTNLEAAFTRHDNTYASTLAVDAAALLTTTDKRFKVYLPLDLTGWANANQLDHLLTPPGVLYRYMLESDTGLANVFPPIPLNSGTVELNGQNMSAGDDFVVTQTGLYWVTGQLVGDFSPWPSDYTVGVAGAIENARNESFHFTRTSLNNALSVVFSLRGIAPIKVTQCPSGAPGSSGALQVSIDLNLLTSPDAATAPDTVLASVQGTTFQLGTVVSEAVAGSGILIERLSTTSNKNIGRLRFSRSDMKFEGEFTTIALRNAKETGSNPILTYIDFLSPATAPTGITAGFKLPNQDFDPSSLKLKIFGTFRGDTAVLGGTVDQTAIFKVVYHVLRPGFVVPAMNEGTAVAVQYWKVTFPVSYAAGTLLTPEYPYDAITPDSFQIDGTTLANFPTSPVAISGGFALGDIFSIMIDRVTQDNAGAFDTYPGRAGLLGLRWILL